jgi:hypothetical protein
MKACGYTVGDHFLFLLSVNELCTNIPKPARNGIIERKPMLTHVHAHAH